MQAVFPLYVIITSVCNYNNYLGCEGQRTTSSHVFASITTAGTAINYASTEFREYLQTTIDPLNTITNGLQNHRLIPGQCYQIDFWVSLADKCGKATKIQIYLSPNQPTHYNSPAGWAGILPTTMPGSQLLETSTVIDVKNGWFHVIKPFIAAGTEKYITIGLFEDESSNKIQPSISPVTSGCSATQCGAGSYPNYAVYYLDDVSLFTIPDPTFMAAYSFSNQSVSDASNPIASGSNVLLNGAVTLSGNWTFNNCTVKCTEGTQIIVPQGKTLTIDGTTITAGCNHMWGGIVVQPGGIIKMNPNSNNTTPDVIEDALTAIDINGGVWQIANSTFNKNLKDIHFSNLNIGGGYFIKNVKFDHTQLLNDQTLTLNHKGIYGINISGAVTAIPLVVGGLLASDICQFIGGQYGIQSTNCNVTVQRSLFSGILQTAIDFQGSNPQNTLRTLTVTSSAVVNSKRCIFSQHRTNLNVQRSSFSGALEHAIEWDDNHDGHLLIGDPIDASQGNTFQQNAWSSVTTWDNKSAQTNATTLATNNTDYTSIVIANNLFNVAPYAGGLLIGEWVLGQNVSYHSLDLSKNKFVGAQQSIQIYNIRGYGGVFQNPAFNVPPTGVFQNQISISTASSPLARGINSENTVGLSYAYNLIGSDNPQNYQNDGIRVQNSEFSFIYNNGIETGTGIDVGGDMLSSGIYCNILQNNVAGILLGWTYLCPDVLHPHGSAQKAYSNSFVQNQPATINIHDYYSAVDHNNWVWDASVTANNPILWYSGIPTIPSNTTPNQSPTSLITTFTGAFDCPYDPGGLIQYAGGTNVHAIIDDPNGQWRADYIYEVQRQLIGQGNAGIASQPIRRIINIEDAFAQEHYSLANGLLNGLNPTNIFEQNYKDVLSIFVDLNFPVKREPTQQEIQTLTAIAQQFPRTGGSAVTLARTFLAVKYNTYFRDEDLSDPKVFGTANIQTPCCLTPASGTVLTFADQFGNELGIPGATVYQDGSFSFDPYQLKYYIQQNPTTTYRIVAKSPSKFTPLDKDFKTLADWILSSPVNVTLGGAKLDITVVTPMPDTVIVQQTSMQDASGNTYSIGVATSQTADFLVQKHDSNGQLLWSKTFNGAASGNDTATCMALDNQGSVYVAGKVWNGSHYNYQAVKYDSTGDMQWASEIEDTLPRENEPTGIAVNNSDETVWMIGKCCSQSGTQYRKAKLEQCVHAPSNRMMSPQQNEPTTISLIEYYPNPTDGKLNVVLKDPSGGTLELFDLNGKLMLSQKVTQSGEIDLTGGELTDGLYLLKFTGNGDYQFGKLVIHRN